jgi:hypothetical protein
MKKSTAELAMCLARGQVHRLVPAPEGEFIVVFNPRVASWVSRRLTKEAVRGIRRELAPSLEIPLTKEGFARAADRKSGGTRGAFSWPCGTTMPRRPRSGGSTMSSPIPAWLPI